MTAQMLRVVNTVRRNGFEIEIVEGLPGSTGVRVFDLHRNAEAFFNFTRRSELAVAKKLSSFYCTAEQEEDIFRPRLDSTLQGRTIE